MTTPVLPVDALEALANAHLLSVAPGTITSVEVEGQEVVVRSTLPSPFADRTPSLWVTRLSRVDGHTIASEPVVLSLPVDPFAGPAGVVESTAQRSARILGRR